MGSQEFEDLQTWIPLIPVASPYRVRRFHQDKQLPLPLCNRRGLNTRWFLWRQINQHFLPNNDILLFISFIFFVSLFDSHSEFTNRHNIMLFLDLCRCMSTSIRISKLMVIIKRLRWTSAPYALSLYLGLKALLLQDHVKRLPAYEYLLEQ